VLCDNSPDLEMIPSGLNDFNRYGGLYRHVNLVYVPAIALERLHITPLIQPGQPATVSIQAKLYNPARLQDSLQISTNIFSPQGAKVYSASQQSTPWDGDREIASCKVEMPELWSPSKPALYRCEVTLTSSLGNMSVTERFGFRYFEFVRHGPFKLNGERLLLRGTHRHEDHALLGAAMPDDLVRKEMKLIQAMGANFIRLAHYQQSRNVLELCDELGLLVWEEIPWSRGGLGGEAYKQQARNMLSAMIDQHYNHPSIIIWGLGNENDWPGDFPEFDAGKIRAFTKELHNQAHNLDPSRKTAMRRCDFCKDIVDVYSPSVWTGWFYGHYTDYKGSLQKELEKVDHLLHIEWGAESYARRHSEETDRLLLQAIRGQGAAGNGLDSMFAGQQGPPSKNGDWSETYACNLFDWCLKEQETMPWLTGSAQWVFKDFSTPLRSDTPVPRVNLKGMVERDLTPKEAYYVFQSYWAEKPMVHIFGHSWPIRWGDPEELKLVKVYSNCESAELFLNGVSLGVKKRNSQDFPAAGLHWTAKFKAGQNQLRAVGHKAGKTITDEIRFQYQTEKWGKAARLELREIERRGETVKVEARLLDAKGALCLDARNLARFGITGAGVLLDHAGTSTASNSLELYCGRAEISLRRNGGTSVVSVSDQLLGAVFLNVE
jgi:beta-galactosidase